MDRWRRVRHLARRHLPGVPTGSVRNNLTQPDAIKSRSLRGRSIEVDLTTLEEF